MARIRFHMGRLPHVNLGTVGIDHAPVKHDPTRGPSFHALWRSGREIRDKCTVCFTNWYGMLHSWLQAPSAALLSTLLPVTMNSEVN